MSSYPELTKIQGCFRSSVQGHAVVGVVFFSDVAEALEGDGLVGVRFRDCAFS